MAAVLGAGSLSRRRAALILLVIGLSSCDLPGAHPNDAAVVNGHAVPRTRWNHLVEVLKSHVPVDLNSDPGKAQVVNIQTQSLRALIHEQLIENLAQKRNITVSELEMDGEVARLATSLGGQAELSKRLDQMGATVVDIRHTIRVNLLQAKMKAASKTYQADFDKALNDAQVTAYVPPCASDHSWPACAGGQR